MCLFLFFLCWAEVSYPKIRISENIEKRNVSFSFFLCWADQVVAWLYSEHSYYSNYSLFSKKSLHFPDRRPVSAITSGTSARRNGVSKFRSAASVWLCLIPDENQWLTKTPEKVQKELTFSPRSGLLTFRHFRASPPPWRVQYSLKKTKKETPSVRKTRFCWKMPVIGKKIWMGG